MWAVGSKPESLRLVQSLPSSHWLHSGLGIEAAAGRVFITRLNDDGSTTLWETNGTSRGTRPLARFEGTVQRFFSLGDRVVFAASREEARLPELWYLDRGMKSPRRVGSPRLLPQHMIQLGDRLFFIAGPENDVSLWRTDGTRGGTRLVQDLCEGTCEPSVFFLRTVLGRLLFTDEEYRLWTTDESGEDPVLLARITPLGFGGLVDLAPLPSGRIAFSGFNDREGPQPWVSDLTPGGTDRILPLGVTLAAGSRIWNLTPFGDKVLFSGCTGESPGTFVSDGTAAGTFLLTSTDNPSEGACTLYYPFVKFTVLGDEAFFSFDGKLWVTDGTPSGTSPFFTPNVPFPRGEVKLGDRFLFVLDPPDLLNNRVWSFWTSEGTEAGTQQAFGLRLGGTPFGFVSVGGEVFFIAQSAESPFPYTLWRTDGTEAGTRKILEVSYPISGQPIEAVRLGGKTILALKGSGRPSVELWVTDGTAAGTVPMISDPEAPGPKNPIGLTVWKDAVWFFTGTGNPGDGLVKPFALWRSDGTAAGTRLIKTVSLPGDEYEVQPPLLTPVEDTLFFRADDGVHGSELWKTDGTTEGTVLVEDIAPGAANAHPNAFAAFNGKLWFSATDGVHGLELWESDGTAAGTRLVEDIFPGPSPSAPEQLTAVPGKLFFAANDGVHGRELWVETAPH